MRSVYSAHKNQQGLSVLVIKSPEVQKQHKSNPGPVLNERSFAVYISSLAQILVEAKMEAESANVASVRLLIAQVFQRGWNDV